MQMTSADPANQSSYKPEINGIRAFAVIAVIINHFNQGHSSRVGIAHRPFLI